MTNEELVTRIQTGEEDLILQLWEQVERLIRWKAHRVARCLEGRGDVAEEDLYQSGYFALVKAVRGYDPEGGAFTTQLMNHIKTEFAEATGYRTQHQRQDPARNALHLDAPITQQDGSKTTVADLVPAPTSDEDPNRDAVMVAADDAMMYAQLCEAVRAALSALPDDQQDILQLRFWAGMTFQEAANRLGRDWSEVKKTEDKAIRALRKPKVAMKLRPFLEFNSYSGTGYGSWSHTGSSVEERYVIRKEKLEAEGRGLTAV